MFQYDPVIGKKTDRIAILTITHAEETRFQFSLLVKKGIAASTNESINKLKEKFGDIFYEIFKINLCDNGSEFDYFPNIETNQNGESRYKTFSTRFYRSNDKAECERNHEYIRFVIPKGVSLDELNLTQEKINLLFSNINSYVRKCLNNKTPYELFVERFELDFVSLFSVSRIDARNVNLKPDLIK